MYSLPSSYYHPSDYHNPYGYSRGPSLAQQRALAAARQQALEQQRAQRLRRHQYLPHESDEDSDDGSYGYYSPYDQLYLRRKEALERAQRDEELHNQRQLEMQRQEQLLRQKEHQRREQLKQAYRHQQAHKIPVRSPPPPSRPSSSQSTKQPTHQPSPSPAPPVRPPSPQTLQRRHEAATLIQNSFRVHHALSKLRNLEKQFVELKESYHLPTTIDFQGPEGIISVPVSSVSDLSTEASSIETPKLAFNSTNYPLHSYTESLNRLLIKLDSVDSWGDVNVRKTRRRLAGRVEGEASRVETYCKRAWSAYINSTRNVGGSGEEDKVMALDNEEHVGESATEEEKSANADASMTTSEDNADDVKEHVGESATEEDQSAKADANMSISEDKADDVETSTPSDDMAMEEVASLGEEEQQIEAVDDESVGPGGQKDSDVSHSEVDRPEYGVHQETQEDGDFIIVHS